MTISLSPILTVRHLTLSIGGETLLDDLSFSIAEGERICLLGASGSGKSLTARAITGTLPAQCEMTGEIWVNGIEVGKVRAPGRSPASRVAAIFQQSATALNPMMSVGKQLARVCGFQQKSAIQDLLHAAGLEDAASLSARFPAELSGGQRQRICTVMALLSQARLLVADEPTTALDVVSQQQTLQMLSQRSALPEAPALLFITHDLALAAQLCQRGLVLHEGHLVESGTIAQFLNKPQHSYTRRLVSAVKRNEACLPQQSGVLTG